MRTFIQASQDATIYQRYPTLNTGLDEILEIGKVINIELDTNNMYASGSARMLINFDIPSLQQYPSSSKYFLNLHIANAKNVNRYQRLDIYPVSRSWIEGSGYFYQDVQNAQDGATWKNATVNTLWTTSGSDFVTNNVSASYTFSTFPLQDIKIDITNIIQPVVSGSNTIPWNGLLIKFPNADETSSANIGNIKVFSSNTHTVFAPTMEIVYADQTFVTGSLKPIPNNYITIIPKNLKEAYTLGEIDRVYLVVRDPYPDRRFDSKQRYKNTYYLPTSSYYRIRDSVSGIMLADFDQYSAINCDTTGSYFTLDTTTFDVNRYYTVDLKIVTNNITFFPEFKYTFKIDDDGA